MSARDELEILKDNLQNVISQAHNARQSMVEEGLIRQSIVGAIINPVSHMKLVVENILKEMET